MVKLAPVMRFKYSYAVFESKRRLISKHQFWRKFTQSARHGMFKKDKIDMSEFPVSRIKNFSIIAHIDHGKSTLADRLLEMTGTISRNTDNKQVLDKLQVERERGITVKAQTVSLFYNYNGETYLLNLIDTPGHVDFSYEVSRSLAACQGVILLVDSAQGVQAQTVSNFFLAFDKDLHIIPVLNKIDLKSADPEGVSKQMEKLFDIRQEEILKISAKTGTGVDNILETIIQQLPCPQGDSKAPLKALLFDSWYDHYRGVICLVAVLNGSLTKGDEIMSGYSKQRYEVMDVGIMYPGEVSTGALYTGQVGFVACGIRNSKDAQIGDTFFHPHSPVEPLSGFKPMKPTVFAGVYPVDQTEHIYLRSAIEKLTLNDASVTVHADSCLALGQGWRLGFLGLLHMDVFKQRLEQEYNASVIVTSPNVPYKVILAGKEEKEIEVLNPLELPEPSMVKLYMEPFVMGTIVFPEECMGKMLTLCESRRGEQQEVLYIDESRVMIKYLLPLSEVIVDFYDELKSQSSGYASFDYEDEGYRETNIVRMDILINGTAIDALSCIVHADKAVESGRSLCTKLKEVIPRQLFEVVIQASIRGRITARETIKALRKDVTAKCYGGDITRKMKLLQKQKEGKKRMKRIGRVDVPHEAFLAVLRR
ncbi:translation factor GUF1 homolog, mitochondrial-like isoform X2 [Montipora capricornis]|uniref:translation factor GUF1 homolog, mitochondrial-like isoform X2 n=1 Tax=Montipora capricornis TaxID=246305 RepID=UPI0035F191CB